MNLDGLIFHWISLGMATAIRTRGWRNGEQPEDVVRVVCPPLLLVCRQVYLELMDVIRRGRLEMLLHEPLRRSRKEVMEFYWYRWFRVPFTRYVRPSLLTNVGVVKVGYDLRQLRGDPMEMGSAVARFRDLLAFATLDLARLAVCQQCRFWTVVIEVHDPLD